MTDMQLPQKLELAMASIDRQYGTGSVVRVGDENVQPIPSVSTGAFSLDHILGIGGLPRGRIVEIYGPEGTGKSTLCLSTLAQAQQQGLWCAYLDTEHAVDPNYAKALGVDMDDMIFAQPDYGEQALQMAEQMIATGDLGVLIVDSVANLVPKAELEGDMEDQQMGLLARLMAKGLRKITGEASKTDTLVIFVNQLREKIGVMFGSPETTPGGRALKFYSSVRIDVRRKEEVKKDGEIIGTKLKAKTVKNKVGPQLRICEFDILYGKGIDNFGCVVDTAVDTGILQKGGGGWYKLDGENIAHGRPAAIELLAADLDLRDQLKEKILGL